MPIAMPRTGRRRKKKGPTLPSFAAMNRQTQTPPGCCKRYEASSNCSCWSCQNNEWARDDLGALILAAFHGAFFTAQTMGSDSPYPRVHKDGVPLSGRIKHL